MMKGVENCTLRCGSDNTLLDLVLYIFCVGWAHPFHQTWWRLTSPILPWASHRPSCQGPLSEDVDCIPDMLMNLSSIHTDVFKMDPDFLENEEKYKTIKKGVLPWISPYTELYEPNDCYSADWGKDSHPPGRLTARISLFHTVLVKLKCNKIDLYRWIFIYR